MLQETNNEDQNGKESELILMQWQTCVEMANSISQRRDAMNNLFVTLNLAIAAAISLVSCIKTIGISIAGMMLCGVWIVFIVNYKELNKEKYSIINEMEKGLPCQPFYDEWKALENNKNYKDFTRIEKVIPVGFFIAYAVVIIISLVT